MFVIIAVLLIFEQLSGVSALAPSNVLRNIDNNNNNNIEITRSTITSSSRIFCNNSPNKNLPHLWLWNIVTNSTAAQSIQIEFESHTLTNSILYIFDGDNYEAKLLARIFDSTRKLPTETVSVIATSGSALLHLHSDRSSKCRFIANITISECPYRDCSGHGVCTSNGHCECQQGWHGSGCEHRSCPLNCSFSGQCAVDSSGSRLACRCSKNILGSACSANLTSSHDSWLKLFEDDDVFESRAWHASIHDPISQRIFTVGGRNTHHVFDDLSVFSFRDNSWQITSLPRRIPALWGHSLTLVGRQMFIIGGYNSSNQFNERIFSYDIEQMKWDVVENITVKIAFHTTNLVNKNILYVVGGLTLKNHFSTKIFVIDLKNRSLTEQDSSLTSQLIEHHTFLLPNLRSILLVLNGHLKLYNLDSKFWITIDSSRHLPHCKTVLLDNDTSLVFICAEYRLHVFSLLTWNWLESTPNIVNNHRIAELSHNTVVTHRNSIFIFGGITATVKNAVWALNVFNVQSQSEQLNSSHRTFCEQLKTCINCLAYSAISHCRWSSEKMRCQFNVSTESEQIIKNSSVCFEPQNAWSLSEYRNISNHFVPFNTSFVKNIDDFSAHNQIDTSMVKIAGVIHPLGAPLRAILNQSSDHIEVRVNGTRVEENSVLDFEDPFLLEVIANTSISVLPHGLSLERITIFEELSHQRFKIHSLANSSTCDVQTNCFECLTNRKCGWKFFDSSCVPYNSSISVYDSVILDPTNCPTCDSIYECKLCDSLPQCQWFLNTCQIKLPENSLSRSVSNCCEDRANITGCLSDDGQCLWCQHSHSCISKPSNVFSMELCEDFDLTSALRDDLSTAKCPLKCRHGRCKTRPESKCLCDLGWTGSLCDVDCQCNLHSSCERRGAGTCDKCRHFTTGNHCERCRPGYFGNATSGACSPCQCNGHGNPELGLCHPQTGQCHCVEGTEGRNCDRCSHGYYGDAKDGGRCYVQCSTRSIISGLNSGTRYFGFHPRQPRVHTINCVWIVVASNETIPDNQEFTTLASRKTDDHRAILVRIFSSTSTGSNCSSSRIFVFDGIPESISGSRLYQRRYFPGLCDGVSQTEFLATSGFATVLYSSNTPLDSFNGSVELYHSSKPLYSFPSLVGKTLWRKQVDALFRPTILSLFNRSLLFLHENSHSLTVTGLNISSQEFVPYDLFGASLPNLQFFAQFEISPKNIYIHGGVDVFAIQDTSEMYQLKISSGRKINVLKADQQPPTPGALFGHTMTTINKTHVILIGGYSLARGFNQQQFIYNPKTRKWANLTTSGAIPIAILGHTSSYSLADSSVYVFGGKILDDNHRFSPSNSMHILNLKTQYWRRRTISGFRAPIPRFLHSSSSTLTNFYVGGDSSVLWSYSYKCGLWSKMQIGRTKHIGSFRVINDSVLVVVLERAWIVAIPMPKEFTAQECPVEEEVLGKCGLHENCIDCLTATDCHWCASCARRSGECIPSTENCDRLLINQFSRPQICTNVTVSSFDQCPARQCLAPDCESCQSNSDCSWFHLNQLSSWIKSQHLYHHTTFDSLWNCVPSPQITSGLDEFFTFPSNENLTSTCAAPCSDSHDCWQCLENESNDCVWSPTLNRCLTRIVADLVCTSGQCGRLLDSRVDIGECPLECSRAAKPTQCIQTHGCGWCQSESTNSSRCMGGALLSSTSETCDGKWHFLTLPKENECDNGHHICDSKTQQCVDLEDGFQCRCLPGHRMDGHKCRPICSSGCINGSCVAPNVCQCQFGFVGVDCRAECRCNGHSQCADVDSLDSCLECRNNTMGTHCEHCLPGFVGNPLLSVDCVSCGEYCHGHSDQCQMSAVKAIAVCMGCANNTIGHQCEQCQEGFFQVSTDISDGCRPCSCNGHGSICSPITGEHCNCANNTESERPCHLLGSASHFVNKTYLLHSSKLTASYSIPCWTHQCTKCRDYFYGTPTHGHQCYRHMFIEKEYCFDPIAQEDCGRNPRVLLFGRTVFFAVQPRYMNVDIRLVLTVIQGDVDVFVSALDDAFVVHADPLSGLHHTYLDSKITTPRNETHNPNNHRNVSLDDAGVLTTIQEPYTLTELFVDNHRPLYHSFKSEHDILVVRKLRQRLEITVPFQSLDLRQARLFVMIRGNLFNANYGQILFRQDQCRIDLFVFFSVFFSSFFFCLSLSVMTWKIKQYLEARRNQIQREIELEIMASRPFGKILLQIDSNAHFKSVLMKRPSTPIENHSSTRRISKSKLFRNFSLGLRESPKIHPESDVFERRRIFASNSAKNQPTPIAVEPTYDDISAIVTHIVQFPTTESGSMNIAIASSLVLQNSSSLFKNLQ